MHILLTGAFGNVGVSTLEALRGRGHAVRCFDVRTPVNEKLARAWAHSVEIVWGDLRNDADVARAVTGCDVVIHLAAIIPPLSEKNPALARAVNVDGTLKLLACARAQAKPPRFIFASSVSVFGRAVPNGVVATVDMPVEPTDTYSGHKVECEAAVKSSGLDWTILRLCAVMPLKLGQMDPIMFEIGLDNAVEFVHTRDVGLAFANAAETPASRGKVLLIGGGKADQLRYREFYTRILDAMGVGMLPEAAFCDKPFYTPWVDTAESQALLKFQRYTLDDYLKEMRALVGWKRPLAVLFSPLVRRWMVSMSPYLKAQPATPPAPPTVPT